MITFIHNKKNRNEIKVRLEKKIVGAIRCGKDGMYRYFPKGNKTGGDPFLSLPQCKWSVAGDTPWEDEK